MVPYPHADLDAIQKAIVASAGLRSTGYEAVEQQLQSLALPKHLVPFASLIDFDQSELLQKLARDPRVEQYGVAAFFPHVADLCFSDEPPHISCYYGRGLAASDRGFVALLRHPQRNLVIKPLQSKREATIATKVAELGGPAQYETLSGYLVEELVPGVPLIQLPADRRTPDAIETIGRNTALALNRLSAHHIVFHDLSVADDMGHSHLMVQDDFSVRLFDFGLAYEWTSYPEFDDEVIWDLVRLEMWVQMGGSDPGRKARIIATTREELKSGKIALKSLKTRDELQVLLGMANLNASWNMKASGPFIKGFNSAFNSALKE